MSSVIFLDFETGPAPKHRAKPTSSKDLPLPVFQGHAPTFRHNVKVVLPFFKCHPFFPHKFALLCFLEVKFSIQAPCVYCLANSWSFGKQSTKLVCENQAASSHENPPHPPKCHSLSPIQPAFPQGWGFLQGRGQSLQRLRKSSPFYT